ncbi:MAG: hypothetical protein ACTIJ6_05420 [Leucobacter sp.]
MTDHTPTTDDMRELFCTPMTESQGINEEFHWEMEGRFDRWLAEVERAAAEKALTDAADAFRSGQISGMFMGRDDYSKAWLRARAAALGLTAGQEGESGGSR